MGHKALLKELERDLKSVQTGWSSGDRQFNRKAALLIINRMLSIEEALLGLNAKLDKALSRPRRNARAKRQPTDWQRFFAAGMKAGKSPSQISEQYRARKGGSTT